MNRHHGGADSCLVTWFKAVGNKIRFPFSKYHFGCLILDNNFVALKAYFGMLPRHAVGVNDDIRLMRPPNGQALIGLDVVALSLRWKD